MSIRAIAGWLLLVAVLVSGWSVWTHRSKDDDTAASGQSSYILRDFELTSLDKQGKEAFTLRAPLLQETPGAKTMELTSPLFFIPDKDASQNYWEVQSKTGWVSENRDEIRLAGAVDARSPEGAARPVQLQSERMSLFPDSRTATSDTAVKVTQPGLTMTGHGMRADLASKQVKLESEVKAEYVPTRR